MKKNISIYGYLLVSLFLHCSCERRGIASEFKSLTNSEITDETQKIDVDRFVPTMPVETNNPLIIQIPEMAQMIAMEDIVASYEFLPLETNYDCLISNISKIICCDELIFILDKGNNSALCFDVNGKYVCSYGDLGRAQDEYVQLTDMDYDDVAHEVVLVDRGSMKTLYFSPDGEFKRSVPMYFYFDKLCKVGGMCVMNRDIRNRNRTQIAGCPIVVSTDSQLVSRKAFQKTGGILDLKTLGEDYLSKKDGNVYYKFSCSDTLWSVTTEKCTAELVVLQPDGSGLFSENEMQRMNDHKYYTRMDNSAWFSGGFTETEDYVFLQICKGGVYNYLQSKKTGREYYGFIQARSSNDIFHTYMLSLREEMFDRDTFIAVLEPRCLVDAKDLEGVSLNIIPEQQRRLLDMLSIEDNPVLMLIKLKAS